MERGPVLHIELVLVHGVNTSWRRNFVTVDGPQMESQCESTVRIVCHIRNLDDRVGIFLVGINMLQKTL